MVLKSLPKPVILGIAVVVLTVAGGVSVPLAQKMERDGKLHEAIKALNVVETKRLVLSGADDRCYSEKEPEHPELNLFMLQHGSPEVLDVLVRRGLRLDRPLRDRSTPMRLAVSQNNAANVRFLLDHGIDVNAPFEVNDGMTPSQSTPLVTAAGGFGNSLVEKRLQMVKLLLDAGAEVNKPDGGGRTALHVASDPEVIKMLLRRGADIEARDKQGRTPLLVAVAGFGGPAIRALLNAGAKIDAVDNEGQGVLHLAQGGLSFVNGDEREARPKTIVDFLIDKGADVFARDAKGRTPLHRCVERRDGQSVRTLVAHGADPNAKDVAGVSPKDLVSGLQDVFKEQMYLALAGLPPRAPKPVSTVGGGPGQSQVSGAAPMSMK